MKKEYESYTVFELDGEYNPQTDQENEGDTPEIMIDEPNEVGYLSVQRIHYRHYLSRLCQCTVKPQSEISKADSMEAERKDYK